MEDPHEPKGGVLWRSQHRDEGVPSSIWGHRWFYRDVVGLKLIENRPPSIAFEFAGNQEDEYEQKRYFGIVPAAGRFRQDTGSI